jgi:hypothetical protein
VLVGALALGMTEAFGAISVVEGFIGAPRDLPAGLLLFAGAVAREVFFAPRLRPAA